jgi:hypothetical protein
MIVGPRCAARWLRWVDMSESITWNRSHFSYQITLLIPLGILHHYPKFTVTIASLAVDSNLLVLENIASTCVFPSPKEKVSSKSCNRRQEHVGGVSGGGFHGNCHRCHLFITAAAVRPFWRLSPHVICPYWGQI